MTRARGWKLYDDTDSAIANGTPFRVCYFLRQEERFLYFATKEEAFQWVADNPTLERPEIKDLTTSEYLYPPHELTKGRHRVQRSDQGRSELTPRIVFAGIHSTNKIPALAKADALAASAKTYGQETDLDTMQNETEKVAALSAEVARLKEELSNAEAESDMTLRGRVEYLAEMGFPLGCTWDEAIAACKKLRDEVTRLNRERDEAVTHAEKSLDALRLRDEEAFRMSAELAALREEKSDGVSLISKERQRQISVEDWSPDHDDQEHAGGQLVEAAIMYAKYGSATMFSKSAPMGWPWESSWWKPCDRLRSLVKAGALIAAEIDRVQRASEYPPAEETKPESEVK